MASCWPSHGTEQLAADANHEPRSRFSALAGIPCQTVSHCPAARRPASSFRSLSSRAALRDGGYRPLDRDHARAQGGRCPAARNG